MISGPEPPGVTVVMPTYERVDLLEVAIESVLQQTHRNLRVIVGDNSSSDCVERLVAGIADTRIAYHRHRPPTASGPHNIIETMKLVTTPYASILCDDDVYHPTFLENLVGQVQRDNSLDVVFCDYEIIDVNGVIDRNETDASSMRSGRAGLRAGRLPGNRAELLNLVLGRHAIRLSWAAVFRTSTFLACSSAEDFMFVDDLAGAYNMVLAGASFAYVPLRLSQLRIHSNTYTGTRKQHRSEDLLYRSAIEAASPEERAALRSALARIQFARGSKLLGSERDYARQQFRAAAPSSVGLRKLLAMAVGHSELVAALALRVRGR